MKKNINKCKVCRTQVVILKDKLPALPWRTRPLKFKVPIYEKAYLFERREPELRVQFKGFPA